MFTTARLNTRRRAGRRGGNPSPWAVALTATAESIAATQGAIARNPVCPHSNTIRLQYPQTTPLYYTQSGDTMEKVAAQFGVRPGEITSPSRWWEAASPQSRSTLDDPGCAGRD